MIIWGRGADTVNLGTLDQRHCEICERERPFNLVLAYRYWGLYIIFNFVTSIKYYLLCDTCGHGWEMEKNEVEKRIANVPTPFMRRYGLAVLALGLAVIITASTISEESRKRTDERMTAAIQEAIAEGDLSRGTSLLEELTARYPEDQRSG